MAKIPWYYQDGLLVHGQDVSRRRGPHPKERHHVLRFWPVLQLSPEGHEVACQMVPRARRFGILIGLVRGRCHPRGARRWKPLAHVGHSWPRRETIQSEWGPVHSPGCQEHHRRLWGKAVQLRQLRQQEHLLSLSGSRVRLRHGLLLFQR